MFGQPFFRAFESAFQGCFSVSVFLSSKLKKTTTKKKPKAISSLFTSYQVFDITGPLQLTPATQGTEKGVALDPDLVPPAGTTDSITIPLPLGTDMRGRLRPKPPVWSQGINRDRQIMCQSMSTFGVGLMLVMVMFL